MQNMILRNIKEFYDITVFLVMLGIAVFMIISDYTYFKKVKYKKDASITLGIAILFVILPFIFMIISKS